MLNTAFISGIFALSGAILGQILNNRLTIKREEKKYNKEIYQELYSPILNDLYAIVDITLNYRKGHDIKIEVHEEEYWSNILHLLEKKLKFANSKVVSAYQEYSKFKYIEDFSGFMEELSRLELALKLLDDIHDNVLKSKIMDNEQIARINYYRNIYLLWIYILKCVNDKHVTEHAMRHYWIFNKDILNGMFYEGLKSRFELCNLEFFPNVFKDVMNNAVNYDLYDIFDSEVMGVFKPDETSDIYKSYEPMIMSKYERNSFLKEIYGWKVYRGRNFLLSGNKEEVKFYNEIANYWSEKEFIFKKKKLGKIFIKITSKGIDYVEKELL